MSDKLQIEEISVSFSGEKILYRISLRARENEFIAILGPSGCGKSTLLKVLTSEVTPEEGRIWIDGVKMSKSSDHFAYMPQEDLLLPWYSILDNVTLAGRIAHQLPKARERALASMKDFGLAGCEKKFPEELSGGMRQRAAFLRTMLCPADILLLDEPFGALDVITRNDMQDWLLQMRSFMPQTILLVTHDIDEALYLADRVLILSSKPTKVCQEIDLQGVPKTRDWLFGQVELRKQIYQSLRGGSHA